MLIPSKVLKRIGTIGYGKKRKKCKKKTKPKRLKDLKKNELRY